MRRPMGEAEVQAIPCCWPHGARNPCSMSLPRLEGPVRSSRLAETSLGSVLGVRLHGGAQDLAAQTAGLPLACLQAASSGRTRVSQRRRRPLWHPARVCPQHAGYSAIGGHRWGHAP